METNAPRSTSEPSVASRTVLSCSPLEPAHAWESSSYSLTRFGEKYNPVEREVSRVMESMPVQVCTKCGLIRVKPKE